MKKKILFIHNPARRVHNIIKSDLKKSGFKVIPARNYDEAIEKGEELRPFMVIMDLALSSSVWDICRTFRKKKKTRKIPLVMLAEQTYTVDMINAKKYKVDQYLARPYNSEEIINLAKNIIKKKKKAKKILVVDDEEAVLNIIESNLSYGGYKVLTASNAQEAFKIAESQEIDMLITDVILPDKDGIKLFLDIKKLPDKE